MGSEWGVQWVSEMQLRARMPLHRVGGGGSHLDKMGNLTLLYSCPGLFTQRRHGPAAGLCTLDQVLECATGIAYHLLIRPSASVLQDLLQTRLDPPLDQHG